jgi:23S rRNA (adenine2503-C2)-methyltransferase
MSDLETRQQAFARLFPDLPAYRQRQAAAAVFNVEWGSWTDVSPLPEAVRATAASEIPWITHNDHLIQESADKEAYKAALKLADGSGIETVLMRNRRGHWTVCVSSQVGCAMKCTFCATGTLGLKRNLNADEIVDQYRFWRRLMHQENMAGQITNIVFMGMGEPLANYEAVREALQQLLEHTDIGPTRITVSTVGLIPVLNQLLDDPEWPPVRLAVSLHSADQRTRERLMPTTYDVFLTDLAAWAERYLKQFKSRRRHLTFEYLMLAGVNDDADHAERLIEFAKPLGKVKINLIPYNATDAAYAGSPPDQVKRFAGWLTKAGLDVTRRRSLGQDIDAACGQLANKQ